MLFLERFLKTLKDFVRLRSQLEASMAEGWIVQEAFVMGVRARMSNKGLHIQLYVVRRTCEQVFYVPCMYPRRLWYVIPVTPRSRSIFADTNIETLADPTIPSQEDANDDDAVEVEENQPFPITNHSEEEDEDEEDDDDSIGEAVEDESIDLFFDLATMGLDMDVSTCRDLLEDEN
ncbi:hypothetical protein GOP47_0022939 [Adiantum capillus-veneris]|uniref:Uncharacterized protein n=1 Tax=Adiantum capillus-veneris TaxID=13818 RepID=A0A9D4U778_ADICA|nr:hypothetical protein GOP47_0022939 [Adiantum capillus-veneris]